MEYLKLGNLTLQGFAQGGWQTSISVPEISSVFDVGVLLPVRADHYFITHGHPDHMGALPYLIARQTIENSGKYINIYYPEEIDELLKTGLSALAKIQGDRGDLPVNFNPAKPGDLFEIKPSFSVRCLKTYHRIPSCGWAVERISNKLLPKYSKVSSNELIEIKKSGVAITAPMTITELVIPGDTTIEFLKNELQAQTAQTLTHEVTSWGLYDRQSCQKYGHTHIDDMIEFGYLFTGKNLIFVHRSMRTSRSEMEEIAKKRIPSELLNKIKFFDGFDLKL